MRWAPVEPEPQTFAFRARAEGREGECEREGRRSRVSVKEGFVRGEAVPPDSMGPVRL